MKSNKRFPTKADITTEQVKISPEDDGLSGILAISHSSYHTNWQALPEHIHDSIELCFCSRGSLVFECNGENHTLLPNNVFLTQPGCRHHLVTNHKGMRMYWLFFKYPPRNRTALGLSRGETSALVDRLKTIDTHPFAVEPVMRQHFRDIFRICEELPRGAYRTLVLRTLVLQILLAIIKSANNRPSLMALSKISEIAKDIAANPTHSMSNAELAQKAKLSESRFVTLFRQVMGLPPYAYLSTCRLNLAKKRLSETRDSIAVISKDIGYSSPQHLATQFHKTFGVTATAWRRTMSGMPH